MFKRALKTPKLKIVYGTDAVAGAHGRNVEEAIVRVKDGGQTPMDAIVVAHVDVGRSRCADRAPSARSRRACTRTSSRWTAIR